MFDYNFNFIWENITQWIISTVEIYAPKIIWALILLALWVLAWVIVYKLVKFAFRKFKVIDLIDRLTPDFDDIAITNHGEWEKKSKKIKFTQKVKVDEIVGKALGYYIFLVFFRYAIIAIGIDEVEKFMADLLTYIPSLFIAVVIWFFWVRFANFVYDIIFQTLKLSKQKTAKIIAAGAKWIVLFFTLMAVLDKVWIATNTIEVILIWVVSMVSIAGWIAFGLWWKEVAQEILESLKK